MGLFLKITFTFIVAVLSMSWSMLAKVPKVKAQTTLSAWFSVVSVSFLTGGILQVMNRCISGSNHNPHECVVGAISVALGASLNAAAIYGSNSGKFKRDVSVVEKSNKVTDNTYMTGNYFVHPVEEGSGDFQVASDVFGAKYAEDVFGEVVSKYYNDKNVEINMEIVNNETQQTGTLMHKYNGESSKHAMVFSGDSKNHGLNKRIAPEDNQYVMVWDHTTPGYASQHMPTSVIRQASYDFLGRFLETGADSGCIWVNTDFHGHLLVGSDSSRTWFTDDCTPADTGYGPDSRTWSYEYSDVGHDEL